MSNPLGMFYLPRAGMQNLFTDAHGLQQQGDRGGKHQRHSAASYLSSSLGYTQSNLNLIGPAVERKGMDTMDAMTITGAGGQLSRRHEVGERTLSVLNPRLRLTLSPLNSPVPSLRPLQLPFTSPMASTSRRSRPPSYRSMETPAESRMAGSPPSYHSSQPPEENEDHAAPCLDKNFVIEECEKCGHGPCHLRTCNGQCGLMDIEDGYYAQYSPGGGGSSSTHGPISSNSGPIVITPSGPHSVMATISGGNLPRFPHGDHHGHSPATPTSHSSVPADPTCVPADPTSVPVTASSISSSPRSPISTSAVTIRAPPSAWTSGAPTSDSPVALPAVS